jgi:glutamyl-tRNA synthetase
MGITHVLRGVEWQASTPKHLLMYRAFGWTPPYFAHLPLIVNSDGSKLSKRQGDLQIESLIAQGFFPEAVVNFVSHVGGGFKDLESQGSLDVCHDLAHLCTRFDLKLMNTNPGRLEMHRLSSLNRVVLKGKVANLENRRKLLDQCLGLVEETVKARGLQVDSFSKEEAEAYLVWATRERISTVKELVADDLIFLWALPKDHLQLVETPKSVVAEIQQAILESKTIDKSLVKILKTIGKNSGLKFPKLMEDLRVLLTGKREGPPVLEVIQVLGKASVARRLDGYLISS